MGYIMNKKGITMIALVITILVMIILGVAAVGTVIKLIKVGKKEGYESISRRIREEVDIIYSEIISRKSDNETFQAAFNKFYGTDQGGLGVFPSSNFASIQLGAIPDITYQTVAARYGMDSAEIQALSFYTVDNIDKKKILNIEDSEFNFYVNFEKNIVFSIEPFDLDGTIVHSLEEIDSTFKIYEKNIDISAIQIGDIIYYDPTKGVTDLSKLTYTSPKGSSKANGDAENVSGNGYADQVFQATSADNKWVVLYIENGKITLMSDDLKNPISGGLDGKFTMNGPTAYLYAEQELHNICSIYGYGKGAVNKIDYITEPMIGSPDVVGDLKSARLIKSGARSMMMEDIEKITGIKTYEDKCLSERYYREVIGQLDWYNNNFLPRYMKNDFYNTDLPIPALKGKELGKPIFTCYRMHKTEPKIPDKLRDIIFSTSTYWIANCRVFSNDWYINYFITAINSTSLSAYSVVDSTNDYFINNERNYEIRPVIIINGIDNLRKTIKEGYEWEIIQ